MSGKFPKGWRGEPPFGWRREGRTLVTDEREQEAILVVLAYHDCGLTHWEVAALLNEEGVKPRRGRWHYLTVRTVLDRHRAATRGGAVVR